MWLCLDPYVEVDKKEIGASYLPSIERFSDEYKPLKDVRCNVLSSHYKLIRSLAKMFMVALQQLEQQIVLDEIEFWF